MPSLVLIWPDVRLAPVFLNYHHNRKQCGEPIRAVVAGYGRKAQNRTDIQ
jgi:hypothetical protein